MTRTRSAPKQDLSITKPLPATVDEITVSWLRQVLHPDINQATVRQVINSTATKVLLDLEYDTRKVTDGIADKSEQPRHICVKGGFNSTLHAPNTQKAYCREASFFAQLSPQLDVRQPYVYYVTTNPTQGQGIVIFEDLAEEGYTFRECSEPLPLEHVYSGVKQLALLHGATWEITSDTFPWLTDASVLRDVMKALWKPDYWEAYFSREDRVTEIPASYSDRIRIMNAFAALWATPGPQCAIHGDPHASNTCVSADGVLQFLDYQNVHIGSPMHDVAYFISGALDPQDRRTYERDILGMYLKALKAAGGPSLSIDNI